MSKQDRSPQGVAQSFLRTRLGIKTHTQTSWLRHTACDEVMSIRQAVQVESIGLTEGQVRTWSAHLRHQLEKGDQAEVEATSEILARSVLPVTALVALRNHWRFTSPAAAFTAFWSESLLAVKRFDPSKGRLRFAAFIEQTLRLRAEAVAEDANGGERKLLERLDALQKWIDELGFTPSVTAKELFEAIQDSLSEHDFERQYFTTVLRVSNALDILQTRGVSGPLSLDFAEDEETGTLSDTLATDPEDDQYARQIQAISPVLAALEDHGLLDDVLTLPEGVLHELLETASRPNGAQWLAAAALVQGLREDFVQQVVNITLPFYKSA